MAVVQINFTLRTSSNVETVHLVGSWDSYHGQLPLSRDKSGKAGSWVGSFRFQNSLMQPGKRYWYYYIIDGYHVSHDPAAEYTLEKTTKRKLNILDVPESAALPHPGSRSSARHSVHDPLVVRGPSPSRIVHPKPSKPYASRQLREGDYDYEDELTSRFGNAVTLSDSDSDISSDPPSSTGSSLSSRTGSTSPSSLSSVSDSSGGSHCSCRRYGITRGGDRVKLDCGGSRCGSGVAKGKPAARGGGYRKDSVDSGGATPIDTDSASSCSSDSDEDYRRIKSDARRQGIAVRR